MVIGKTADYEIVSAKSYEHSEAKIWHFCNVKYDGI